MFRLFRKPEGQLYGATAVFGLARCAGREVRKDEESITQRRQNRTATLARDGGEPWARTIH
jgi:hypothetical protein